MNKPNKYNKSETQTQVSASNILDKDVNIDCRRTSHSTRIQRPQNYIKQIGKGSFSNVYLFKNDNHIKLDKNDDANLTNSLIFDECEREEFYITKEVDLNLLVKKYLNKTFKKNGNTHKRLIDPDILGSPNNYTKTVYHYRRKSEIDERDPSNGVDISPNKNRRNSSTKIVNITPYSTFTSAAYHKNKTNKLGQEYNLGKITTQTIDINMKYSEDEYYYNKLKELIDSEIEILKNLEHENITRYISSIFVNDTYSIKMEYCNLGDVYSFLKSSNIISADNIKNRLSNDNSNMQNISNSLINNTKNTGNLNKDDNYNVYFERNLFDGFVDEFIKIYLFDTVSALKYIHNKGLIHRDIKLHNILIKEENNKICKLTNRKIPLSFKISDFGFTCYTAEEICDISKSLELSQILQKKYYKLCGTPYYMAPEVILNIEKFEQLMSSDHLNRGKKFYDNKIDLWSYGICLYELIFNILPFSNMTELNDLKIFYNNSNTQNLIYKNIDEKHIISDDIKILLKKLLTIDPDYRFTTNELYDYVENMIVNDKKFIIQNALLSSSILKYNSEADIMQGVNILKKENLNQKEHIIQKENLSQKENNSNFKTSINPEDNLCQKVSNNVINIDSWIITDFENISIDLKKDKYNTKNKKCNNKDNNIRSHLSNTSSEIDKSIMKMSVDNKFMKWLAKK